MQDAVIVSYVRTPVGSFGGTLKETPVVQPRRHRAERSLEKSRIEAGCL